MEKNKMLKIVSILFIIGGAFSALFSLIFLLGGNAIANMVEDILRESGQMIEGGTTALKFFLSD